MVLCLQQVQVYDSSGQYFEQENCFSGEMGIGKHSHERHHVDTFIFWTAMQSFVNI